MDRWTDGRMSGHKSLTVPGSCHITPRIMLRTTSDTITPNPFTSQVGNRDSQRGNDSYETAKDSRGTATVKAQVRPTWFELRPTAPVVRAQTHGPQGQNPDPRPPGTEPRPMAPRVRARTHGPQGQSPDPRPPGSEPGPTAPRLPSSPRQSWGLPKTTAGEARRDSHVVKRKGAGNSLGSGRGSPRRPGGAHTSLPLRIGLVRQARRPWFGDRGSKRQASMGEGLRTPEL